MTEISVTSEKLRNICIQLQAKHRPGRTDGIRTAHRDVLREGWGMHHDLQDVLWETDDRADAVARNDQGFDFLLPPFRLHWTSCFRRPSASAKSTWGGPAMRPADLAMLVMEVERLGFSVDAHPLVTALRPGIMKQKHVTTGELAVLWYKREQHRFEPLVLRADGPAKEVAGFITQSGYRATVLLGEDGPVTLRVDPPKGRRGFPLKYWIPGELQRTQQHS